MNPASRPHPAVTPIDDTGPPAALARRYARVRAATEALAAPLSEADCQVQSMPDASPTRWHLAHVTWFFETFVLERYEPGFQPHHPAFRVLFNSYYHGVGEQFPRPQRGLITRPTLVEVMAYRAAVDARMAAVLSRAGERPDDERAEIATLVTLGLEHEQQHQELILTDLKHLFGCNPLAPVYRPAWPLAAVAPVAHGWCEFAGGLVEIGHALVDAGGHAEGAGDGFAFDNETPRHAVHLRPYALGNRLVTHGEWLEFVQDGGYAEPRWWLSAGWDWLQRERIEAPMCWRRGVGSSDASRSGRGGGCAGNNQGGSNGPAWRTFTLHGEVPLDPHTPVVHVSLYEADAYARWRGAISGEALRLPTEAEWEHAAQMLDGEPGGGVVGGPGGGPASGPGGGLGMAKAIAAGNFVETGALHPLPLAHPPRGGAPMQMFGDAWEWTYSAYHPYPGYRPWAGAVGEYNGKFMVNQYVLRGGSCATPREHIRASYRNFFPAEARWQFSGVRLAKSLD